MEKIAGENVADISVSVVSHAQIGLVANLMRDIEEHCRSASLELILTLNLDEALPFSVDSFSYPVRVIRNSAPMGFAANHNQAFAFAAGRYFCVLNPDIRFADDPFRSLLECLEDSSAGVVAPLVLGEGGEIEDSARHFPGPLKILCKVFGKCRSSDYVIGDELIYPDWAGGMFLLFSANLFKELGGFDARYFLYYEDVDICARLRLSGHEVVLCPRARVIHHAQRSSHRSFKYLRWHLRSMMRFFVSPVYWRLKFHKFNTRRRNLC